jgi:hypothetical protein
MLALNAVHRIIALERLTKSSRMQFAGSTWIP